MLNLLNNYSLSDIVIFAIIIAFAVKEFLSLLDFFIKRINEKFTATYKSNDEKEELKIQINEFKKILQDIQESQAEQREIIDTLLKSDVEDIRSWMVRQYNYFKSNPDLKIDDFEMDCIEKRFECYKKEGGNSYIHDIVHELREIHNQRK